MFCHPLNEKYADYPAKTYSGHNLSAFDFECPEGTNVYSMSDGVVYNIYLNHTSMGNAIIIKAKNTNWNIRYKGKENEDIYFRYLHLSSVDVKAGEEVKIGKLIGSSGNTGDSDGAHLHVDIMFGEYGTSGYPTMKKTDFRKNVVVGYYDGTKVDESLNEGPYTRAIFAQNVAPIYSSNNSLGGTILKQNQWTLPNYLDYMIKGGLMGETPKNYGDTKWPDSAKEMAEICPAMYAAGICLHEYNSSQLMDVETAEYNTSLLYSKLFRSWLMYPNLSRIESNEIQNLQNMVIRFDEFGNTGESNGSLYRWMSKYIEINDDFINYAQNVYNNIRYPLAYGIKESTNVEDGISRLTCAAAGIFMNLSEQINNRTDFPQQSNLRIEYKFKEALTPPYVGLMYQGYWDGGAPEPKLEMDNLEKYIPETAGGERTSIVQKLINESNGKTKADLESECGWNVDIPANWCARYAKVFISKMHELMGKSCPFTMTDSTSETMVNLILTSGLEYYAERDIYVTKKISKKTDFLIGNFKPGDIICFDHFDPNSPLDDSTKAENLGKNNFDHIGIITSIDEDGKIINTIEGNTGGTSYLDSKVSEREYYMQGNGKLSRTSVSGSTDEQNFVLIHWE